MTRRTNLAAYTALTSAPAYVSINQVDDGLQVYGDSATITCESWRSNGL